MATHPELVAAGWDITDYPCRAIGDFTNVKPDEACAETNMDSGMVRKRRRMTIVFDKSKVRWLIPDDVIRLFRLWYAHETNMGQSWFKLNFLTGYEYDGCTNFWKQCQFSSQLEIKKVSPTTWEITAELRIVGDNGARVNTDGTLTPLPARNTWDDTVTWEETL